MYELMLKSKGFDIIEKANNGEIAISIFKSLSEKPDIILLDYRMPVKNGLEAAKEILSLKKKSKIIFASADNSIKNEAISIGASIFLKKPFTHEELITSVNKALNSPNRVNSEANST